VLRQRGRSKGNIVAQEVDDHRPMDSWQHVEWQDFDAVYDAITRHIPTAYGLSGATQIELNSISENANFLLTDPQGGGEGVLRVHRHDYHGPGEIESELAWMQAVRRETSVLCPSPIPQRDGGLVTVLPMAHGRPREAVMFTRAPGENLTLEDATPYWYERLGRITAELHAHSLGWTRPTGFHRYNWLLDDIIGPHARFGYWGHHPRLDPSQKEVLRRVEDRLREAVRRYESSHERIGLIHGDLHLLNLMVHGDELWSLDFDDCGMSWFMFDVGAAMQYIPDDPIVEVLTDAWVRGYTSLRALSGPERESLPHFVMLRRLLTLGWAGTHPLAPVPESYGDVVARTLEAGERYLSNGRAG
jgi:Ser/Thr protein kinase RdoA (MazF antagonist)